MPFQPAHHPPPHRQRSRPISQTTIGLLLLILWLVYIILHAIN